MANLATFLPSLYRLEVELPLGKGYFELGEQRITRVSIFDSSGNAHYQYRVWTNWEMQTYYLTMLNCLLGIGSDMQDSLDATIDMMIQAAYHSIVHNQDRMYEAIQARARLGLMSYLREQNSNLFDELFDESVEHYLTICSHYVTALYLFAALTEGNIRQRTGWQALEKRIAQAYLQVCGLERQKFETLAQMSLQFLFFSLDSTEQDVAQKAYVLCIRHFEMLHIQVNPQEALHLHDVIEAMVQSGLMLKKERREVLATGNDEE